MNEFIIINPNDLRTLFGEVLEEKFPLLVKFFTFIMENINSSERLLSTKEVMNFLGISRSTLNRWKDNGTIPVYGLDKGIYYLQSDILKALKRLN